MKRKNFRTRWSNVILKLHTLISYLTKLAKLINASHIKVIPSKETLQVLTCSNDIKVEVLQWKPNNQNKQFLKHLFSVLSANLVENVNKCWQFKKKFNVNTLLMFLVHIGSYSWLGKRESAICLSQKIYLSKQKYSLVQRRHFRAGHVLEFSVLLIFFSFQSLRTNWVMKLMVLSIPLWTHSATRGSSRSPRLKKPWSQGDSYSSKNVWECPQL